MNREYNYSKLSLDGTGSRAPDMMWNMIEWSHGELYHPKFEESPNRNNPSVTLTRKTIGNLYFYVSFLTCEVVFGFFDNF